MNKTFSIRGLALSQLFLVAASESALAGQKVFEDLLKTNVIAAVVGYQTTRTVGPNVHIPMFAVTPEAGNGEEKGILFQVVAPSNYASKFFWMHHDGLLESGKSFELYSPNLLYSFRFSADTNDIGSVTEANLFCIAVSGKSLCTLRPSGIPFFTSKDEIACKVKRCDERLRVVSNQLEEARIRLRELEVKTREYNRCLGFIRQCESSIASAARNEQAIRANVEKVEENSSFIRSVLQEAHNDKDGKAVQEHRNE